MFDFKVVVHQVRNDIDFWIEGNFESFSLELDMGSSKFLISVVYQPPSASWEEFERGLDQLARAVSRTGLAGKNLSVGLINLHVRCLGQI